MTKNKRTSINEKPLSRNETNKLAKEQGKFHDEYSDILTEKYNGKILTVRHVYELPENRYLYIRDVNGKYDGKGDIFTKEDFEKFVQSIKRMDDDSKNGRTNNIAHWHFYSIQKENLIYKVPELLAEFPSLIKIENKKLDFSTKSLDIISNQIKKLDLDHVFKTLYDNLVAYCGEVIKSNSSDGLNWSLEPHFNFPILTTATQDISYNPINIIWEELTQNMDGPNFRNGYGKEKRAVGERVKMNKIFQDIAKKNSL
jgi:hypothetical protein